MLHREPSFGHGEPDASQLSEEATRSTLPYCFPQYRIAMMLLSFQHPEPESAVPC